MNKVTKNVVWNLAGSLVYYFSQWLMTVLVVRISGDYAEAGVFALALSVSAIFSAISNYSVRPYQVADINDKFENGTYVVLRLLTCAVSLLLMFVYLVVSQYSIYITMAIVCFMLIRLVEALVDVFQSMFLKQWRTDIVGRSLVVRGIVGLLMFSIVEYLFKNIAVTCLATALSTGAIAVFMDIMPCFRMNEIKLRFDRKRVIGLMLCCTPLFLNSLMANLIPNFPKILGEKMLGEDLIGYYASVTTPAVVVQLVSTYCFSPLIPLLTKQFSENDKKINSVIAKVQLLIIGVGVMAVIGFLFLGDWALSLVFGEEILPYGYLLIPAVIVSILTATVYFLSTLFTVVERNKTLVAIQAISVVIVSALTWFSLNTWELQGINFVMMIAYSLFIVIGYIVIFKTIKAQNKKKEVET